MHGGREDKDPAQKPVRILKHIIEIASSPNDVVFDPFMGVASSGIAALESKRIFYGCEINKLYYGAGIERIKKFYLNHSS